MLNGKFSQPYSQYPEQARASGGDVYPLLLFWSHICTNMANDILVSIFLNILLLVFNATLSVFWKNSTKLAFSFLYAYNFTLKLV